MIFLYISNISSINQVTIKIQSSFTSTLCYGQIIHSTLNILWKSTIISFDTYLIYLSIVPRPDQVIHQQFTKWEIRLSPSGRAKDTSCSGIFSALFPFAARRQLPLALASASFRF